MTSEEQGKVSLGDSFEPVTRRERIRQQRAKAFKDTKWDAQLRTYLLDRDKFDGSESSSMALGGYIGFKTGWFRDKFSFGATAYTSQRLYGPEDKDGAGLLQTGQDGYAVLGEAYLEYRFTDSVFFDIGRKALQLALYQQERHPDDAEHLRAGDGAGRGWRSRGGRAVALRCRLRG